MKDFTQDFPVSFVSWREQAFLDLAHEIKHASLQGVVFTNGVFDLLHVGHVALLEFAAKLRYNVWIDMWVIVGVNSDASATRAKGKGRPYNNLEDRIAMLMALRWVDVVVGFDEDTPEELLQFLRPDVLLKGGEYALDGVVGREHARDVVLAPMRHAQHTTTLAQRIYVGEVLRLEQLEGGA